MIMQLKCIKKYSSNMECPRQGRCFFVAVLAILATGAFAQEKPKCSIIADIGILVDSSGSVRREFHKEKQFIRDVATALNVSKTGVNIGVVTFSDFAELSIKLSDTQDTASFNRAVDQKVTLMGSQTYIDRGLHKVDTELFTEANGDRKEAPNLLLLLTDGKQTRSIYSTPPEAKAEALRKRGVTIIAIGIGRRVDALELATLTGSLENVFLTRSFDDLLTGGFLQKIVSKTFEKAVAPKCRNLVDVGFIVDSSGSLRREYSKEKEFVKALADSFSISPNGSRGGVITFSWHAELSVKLSDYVNSRDFNKAVDGLPLFGSTTRIDKALLLARDQLFTSKNGGRANIPKILVLLTDGKQTNDVDAVDPGDIATEIRQAGVRLIVIGIGKKVNIKELLHMAGDKSNLYQAGNFDELNSSAFVASVSKTIC